MVRLELADVITVVHASINTSEPPCTASQAARRGLRLWIGKVEDGYKRVTQLRTASWAINGDEKMHMNAPIPPTAIRPWRSSTNDFRTVLDKCHRARKQTFEKEMKSKQPPTQAIAITSSSRTWTSTAACGMRIMFPRVNLGTFSKTRKHPSYRWWLQIAPTWNFLEWWVVESLDIPDYGSLIVWTRHENILECSHAHVEWQFVLENTKRGGIG